LCHQYQCPDPLPHTWQAYMKQGPECGFTLGEIANYAEGIIQETSANPPNGTTQIDFGFWASFWAYAKAEALA
jgi:hypothetical protein